MRALRALQALLVVGAATSCPTTITDDFEFSDCPPREERTAVDECDEIPALCQLHATTLFESDRFSANAFDIVFLSEGFRDNELDVYRARVESLVLGMLDGAWFTEEEKRRFHFYRLDVPAELAEGTEAEGRPFLGCVESGDGGPFLRRLASVGTLLASTAHGGSQVVPVVVFNTVSGRANSAVNLALGDGSRVLVHELGHALFGLGDEYSEFALCATDICPTQHMLDVSGGANNASPPNLTYDSSGQKWSAYVQGAVEGGARFERCVYHPTDDCVMGSLTDRFCPVCRAVIEGAFQSDYVERLPGGPAECDVRGFVDGDTATAYSYASSPDGVASQLLEMGTVDIFDDPEAGTEEITFEALVTGGAVAFSDVPFCIEGVLPSSYRQAKIDLDAAPAAYYVRVTCNDGVGHSETKTYFLDNSDRSGGFTLESPF